jgi:hypothetical protein
MAHLDQDQAALNRERLMRAHVRTANPAAGGVGLKVIFKDPAHHEYLFANRMPMPGEQRSRYPQPGHGWGLLQWALAGPMLRGCQPS